MELMAKIMAEAAWLFELRLGDIRGALVALYGMGL